MIDDVCIFKPENVAVDEEAVKAQKQWEQDGTVTAKYLKHILGDISKGVFIGLSRQQDQKIQPPQKYAIDRCHQEAIQNVVSMEEAAKANQRMDLGLAGMNLYENLRELWRLRRSQSDEWKMILNFLQCALSKEVFEEFTVEQCRKLQIAIEKHLTPSAGEEDIQAVIDLLENASLDPFKPFAGFRDDS